MLEEDAEQDHRGIVYTNCASKSDFLFNAHHTIQVFFLCQTGHQVFHYHEKTPHGKKNACAVHRSGEVTKGFDTLQELADYIYTEFGSTWRDHILAKEVDQRRMRLPTQYPIRETRAISDEEMVCDEDVTIPVFPKW